MIKRIFVLFLSVLIIVTFSSCKEKREFYQGEQTAYVYLPNGYLLDISKTDMELMTREEYIVDITKGGPSFSNLEKIRNFEGGFILVVTVLEHPKYVLQTVENAIVDSTEGTLQEENIVYTLSIDRIIYQGKELSLKKNNTVFLRDRNVLTRHKSFPEIDLMDQDLSIPEGGYLENELHTAVIYKVLFTEEEPAKLIKSYPILRKGYSYIIYGGVRNDGSLYFQNGGCFELSSDEDRTAYYQNLGLSDPEHPQIRAKVLEKYWYN